MRVAQRGWVSRLQAALAVGVLTLCVTATVRTPALATLKYGPLQVSGNLETQNLVRHTQVDKFQLIQNRNTFRLRVDWDWLQNGKLIEKIDVPFIERSKLYVLYRGVYDGFYDIGPRDLVQGQTRYDDLIGGRITNVPNSQLDGWKFENRLREAYVDAKLADLPVSFRIGRQQVIWGESDQFRIMDIWNPLDITWHFQQESWDNVRVPLWLGKGLWDIGDVGPLSNTFLEVVYNAFDFQPGIKPGFLPQPWALPFPDPLRPGQIQKTQVSPDRLVPFFDLEGTSLRQGDFKRNPQEASEVGTRFHFVTPQGIELSLNYLYGRGRGVGAAAPFAVRLDRLEIGAKQTDLVGLYQIDGNAPVDPRFLNPAFDPTICNDPVVKGGTGNVACVRKIDVTGAVVHPYMHIFGLTGNYFEGDLTQAVFRFESAYVMGEPYQTTEADKLPALYLRGAAAGTGPFQFTKRDIWTGMIGFDRPTWIRWLNSKSTWFLTGQFFWHNIPGHSVDHLVGTASAGDDPYLGPTGRWVAARKDSRGFIGQVERQQNGDLKGNGDNARNWEHLITFAGTSFYRGGTIVPFIADAWDPVNDNNEFLWNVDYYYSNDFIITLQQKFFMTYGSKLPSNDPWYAGGRFTRRDETGVKLTYQF